MLWESPTQGLSEANPPAMLRGCLPPEVETDPAKGQGFLFGLDDMKRNFKVQGKEESVFALHILSEGFIFTNFPMTTCRVMPRIHRRNGRICSYLCIINKWILQSL